jgi:membrane-associated protease RseP (regulator of RpoE activity)
VDGKTVAGNVDTLISTIKDHPDRPVTVVVDRNGVRKTLTVTPANGRVDHEAGAVPPKGDGHAPYGVIGVSLGEPTQVTNPVHALASTGSGFGTLFVSSITGIGHLVSLFSPHGVAQRFQEVTSAKAAHQAAVNGTRPLSTVGVVQTANDAVEAGIGEFLYFLALVNIFFGVFNLFPMLPLDGGHVAIAVYEKIRTGRRKVMYHADVAKLMPFTWMFLLFLAVLIVPALLTDIVHPIANPFG